MKNISSVISQINIPEGVLKISVTVTIENTKGKYFISKYENDGSEYITIDPDPRMVIRLRINGMQWGPSQQIIIHHKYFEDFKIRLSGFYTKVLSSSDIYKYGEAGELESVSSSLEDILLFKDYEQFIRIEPDLLEDKNFKIPGIRITMNQPDITSVLSFDEFESFYKEIERMSLHDKGMALVNAYMSYTNIRSESIVESYDKRYVQATNRIDQRNIFANKDSNKEQVRGPIFNKHPESLMDI